MKVLYFSSKGAGDPTGASIPLHLAANGSLEVGDEVAIALGGDATDLVFQEQVADVQGVGVPSVQELIAKLVDHQVPVYV
ncbi:MAG: DsrE family protein [Actinomycetota bacterium]|nr:DsrE family protein [Actinomycetota bacterium]